MALLAINESRVLSRDAKQGQMLQRGKCLDHGVHLCCFDWSAPKAQAQAGQLAELAKGV